MFIKLTDEDDFVIIFNVLHIRKVVESNEGSVVMVIDGAYYKVKEKPDEVLKRIKTECYDLISMIGKSIKIF